MEGQEHLQREREKRTGGEVKFTRWEDSRFTFYLHLVGPQLDELCGEPGLRLGEGLRPPVGLPAGVDGGAEAGVAVAPVAVGVDAAAVGVATEVGAGLAPEPIVGEGVRVSKSKNESVLILKVKSSKWKPVSFRFQNGGLYPDMSIRKDGWITG